MSSRSLSFGGGSAASSTVHSPLSSGRISRHQNKLFSNGGQLHLNEAALAAAVSAGAGGDDAADRDEELLALEGQLGREEAQELQQLFSILDKVGRTRARGQTHTNETPASAARSTGYACE